MIPPRPPARRHTAVITALISAATALAIALPAAGATRNADAEDTEADTADTEADEGAAAAQGTVQTLTGPGYCPGTATPVESSREVRALALDRDGMVFYETGPVEQPAIATVTADGQVRTLVSGIPQPPTPSGAPPATRDTPAGAGRMVASGADGVIVAAGTRLVRIDRDNSITTLAGDPAADLGTAGQQRAGDGGPAEQARFRSATSLARDADGNLYVADHGGLGLARATVRFVNRSHEPVTFYPDTPDEVTIDPGHIDTIAGIPDATDTTDAGADEAEPDETDNAATASTATFHGNTTLAVDDDRLYVASALDETSPEAHIQVVNLGGEDLTAHGQTTEPGGITTVAGGGDDPTTTITAAAGIAVAGDDLYVADPARHRIRHVDKAGFMATLAGAEGLGAAVGGFNGNRRAAVGARLNRPFDVATGPDGDVYVADKDNGQVRVVNDTGHIRGVPGAGIGLTWHCQAADAADDRVRPQPGGPAGVATGADGGVYLALADAHQVKRLNPTGQLTTVAGRTGEKCPVSCAGFAGDGGPATEASLDTPTAVALGPSGGLYILDGGNARIRYVNPTDEPVTVHGVAVDPGHIATVAGTATPGRSGDGGPALDARLGEVTNPGLARHGELAAEGFDQLLVQRNFGDLAVDSDGHLFIAETKQHPDDYDPLRDESDATAQVRRVTPDGQITTIAGTGAPGAAGECCHDPAGLALDDTGNLYIADASSFEVWLLNRGDEPLEAHGQRVDAGEAAVVAGSGTSGFEGDGGPATEAQLLSPAGLAVDDNGVLHIAELAPAGSLVRSVDAGGTIDVLVGNARSGYNGDGLPPPLTSVNLPTDLAVDGCGNVLVADAGNDRVRRVNLAGPCDPAAQQAAGASDGGGPAAATVGLVALAVAVIAGSFAAGWYWRRRSRGSAAGTVLRR